MRPGTHYSIDFVTGFPISARQKHDALMVIVDRYSKMLRAIPTWKKADAKLTAELFLNHVAGTTRYYYYLQVLLLLIARYYCYF